uniref:HDC04261 n=1 Tax=Drosophila melanogaster TaxID=7227 RepID=Q6IGY4_DROME|nr:TPA_inf: HDC04261 [Drosophila melanogaster]
MVTGSCSASQMSAEENRVRGYPPPPPPPPPTLAASLWTLLHVKFEFSCIFTTVAKSLSVPSLRLKLPGSPLRICIWNPPVAVEEIACEPTQTVGNLHKFRLVTSDIRPILCPSLSAHPSIRDCQRQWNMIYGVHSRLGIEQAGREAA